MKSSKKQIREEVFSSKHRTVEPCDDSNSSGISVQQKRGGTNGDCCHGC
jgi:hypothetical protein